VTGRLTVERRRVPVATLVLVALLVAGLTAPAVRSPGAQTGTGWAVAWTDAEATRWPDDAVVYHVFVDRFADGDADTTTQVAGTPDDPGYADALTDWMGGDLAGVRSRLDHIVTTGANTIWLSPVTPGPFFHGYHPTDLTDVDPRFGDVDTLRGLVADAQERGLKVVYDLVLNHTSDRHPWFVDAQAACDSSPYVAYYRFRSCPDEYAGFAGLSELPQLQPDHPALRDELLEVVLPFWLDDIGVDGFRLDHVEGPSRDFWTAFGEELDARWPETLVLGEVWATQTVIDSYGPLLDSATAFPFRDRLLPVFARGGNAPAASLAVAGWLDDDGHLRPDRPIPSTYLSSHDQSRFTFEAGGDRERTALAHEAILTLPGHPTIYYGDEVGLSQTDRLPEGAPFQDRWYREPMPWNVDAWDLDLAARVAAAARLRTTTPALGAAGAYHELVSEGTVWVFERSLDGERYLVVLNGSDTEVVEVDVEAALSAGARPAAEIVGDVLGGVHAEVADGRVSSGATNVDGGRWLEVAPLRAVVLELR
jgi:cyclomaltodextrinase / maltogenic alpha-amylase / neopullulanase